MKIRNYDKMEKDKMEKLYHFYFILSYFSLMCPIIGLQERIIIRKSDTLI